MNKSILAVKICFLNNCESNLHGIYAKAEISIDGVYFNITSSGSWQLDNPPISNDVRDFISELEINKLKEILFVMGFTVGNVETAFENIINTSDNGWGHGESKYERKLLK